MFCLVGGSVGERVQFKGWIMGCYTTPFVHEHLVDVETDRNAICGMTSKGIHRQTGTLCVYGHILGGYISILKVILIIGRATRRVYKYIIVFYLHRHK